MIDENDRPLGAVIDGDAHNPDDEAGSAAGPMPESFAAAYEAARAAPQSEEAWDELEARAAEFQRPDDVAALYRKALKGDVSAELANVLGQRAARFHDEWFAEPDPLVKVLTRVLAIDADADWAFQRLSLLFTSAARWTDLLALYDGALTTAKDKQRRIQLLDEAAHIAKDFAGQPDRAIAYLEHLFPLKPQDAQLATSLERLFEQQKRYHDLIKLWTARVAVLAKPAARQTRARIAACWLDQLKEPAEALAQVELLLKDDPNDAIAIDLLERVGALASAAPDVRRRALSLLKTRYGGANRVADVVRVLETNLAFAERAERIVLHREIAERLIEQTRETDAIEHYASLVVLDPADTAARGSLRALAQKNNAHRRYADALAQAAEAGAEPAQRIALIVEGADVRCDVLGDEPGAIELYARVLPAAEAPPEVTLTVARRLATLLERAGRSAEQLDVLERLATLEPETAQRSAVLGQAARLADQLGDADRALASWQHRLEDDARDLEALDAMVDLLERNARWEPLIAALRRRTACELPDERVRADLVRIARTYADKLASVQPAIAAWVEVGERFGRDAETVDSLADLYAAGGQWTDLAALLERAASAETNAERRATLQHRLGDAYRERLADPTRAVACYRAALESDPRNEGGRNGLHALLEEPSCAGPAVEALAAAYAATDEWDHTLDILEPRLVTAADDAARTAILLDAAGIHEKRGENPSAALDDVCRAFPLSRASVEIEREVLRLAEATERWSAAVDAYRQAIAAAADDTARVAELHFRDATILETRLADLPAALEAYSRVTALRPDALDASEAAIRVAARTARWDSVAAALVDSARARGRVEPALTHVIESIANENSAWDDATTAIGALAASPNGLAPAVARDLENTVALWHRDRRGDADAAETALLRAVAHDATHAETLRTLAALQRRSPGRPLVTTLLQIADAADNDPEALHEAAAVALDTLADRELAQTILLRLRDVAAARWTASPSDETQELRINERTPEQYADWSIEQLVKIYLESGSEAAAVELLVQGAALPFAPEHSREMRHQAAQIAAERLNDAGRAMRLYSSILNEAPDDARAIARLAALYEAGGRLTDLLALRRHELELTTDVPRRLELRLDIARVLGTLGDRAGRVEALRANLAERPGHGPSVSELAGVLEAESNHEDLASMLAEQAAKLEEAGERAEAASLWTRVADLAERHLADVPRALDAHRRVVALEPTHHSLDALARLHADRGEHADAVGWLEQRLASTTDAAERATTVVRLARSHVGAGKPERARESLERALAEDPSAGAVRSLLGELYRTAGFWEPLARLLTDGAEHVADKAAQLAFLREAAEIYHRRLNAPETAIPILERAVPLAPPADRTVRSALADALRAAGRLDEARALLEKLVEEFGRRRPPERAAVHYQLAQIAHSRGDLTDALAQLDVAASIDMGHAGIHRMLGELSRAAGQMDRAERAFRTLLLIVRRQQPVDAPTASDDAIGQSEVLFELYKIAQTLEQPDRANEILESAFETAAQSENEAKRFERSLRADNNPELLFRALQNRLARVQDPAAEASVLGEVGDLLASMGRVEEALDARLKALGHAPGSIALHEGARALAKSANRTAQYVERVGTLASAARESGDNALACELYLRQAETVEQDQGDARRAAEVLSLAEQTGEQAVRVVQALDRVYRATGDAEGQRRVLRRFVEADVADADRAGQNDAVYRLAEIELSSAETRDEGADRLAWALDRDPQYERAAAIARTAAAAEPGNEKLVALYERVARASGDQLMLLDAIELTAALSGATPDLLREGVEIANQQSQGERAEKLLLRAVENSRASSAGLSSDDTWALVALAERRKAAGDGPAAVRWLQQAAEVADAGESFQLWLEVASLAAGPVGDLALAAQTLERLRAKEPGDRNVWQPLLEVYRKLNDEAKLSELIASTIDQVYDTVERNLLRLERARLLLTRPANTDDAVGILREILDEQPDNTQATAMLGDIYERAGRWEDLSELLTRLLDAARDRQDGANVAVLSLRLGGLYGADRRDDALALYKSALEWAPTDRALLTALLALYRDDDDAGERADAMEKLLAIETGEAAAKLAFEVIALRQAASDDPGVERALELGLKGCPGHEEIRSQLEQWYAQRGEPAKLAALIVADADARPDAASAVARLREGAAIYRDQLGDFAAAAEALRRAREKAPDDLGLTAEYARALTFAGQHEPAMQEVSTALAGETIPMTLRAELLKLRAEIRSATGDDAAAAADLEEAYTLGGAPFAEPFANALDQRRQRAHEAGDRDVERSVTLRLSELLAANGDERRGRDILAEWVGREPTDKRALKTLADMDAAAGRWDDVAQAYARLLDIETGDDQAETALKLAEACEKAGQPEAAREGLERVHAAMPRNERVRVQLRKLYDRIGAHAELAELSLADAEAAGDDASRFDLLRKAGELKLRSVGDAPGAVGPLERALKLKPNDHEALVMLADAYTTAGSIEQATSLLETAIAAHKGRRSKELGALQHRMARVAYAAGDRSVELAWLNVALDSDMQNGHVATELAEVAMELRNFEVALKALRAVTLMKVPGPMSKAMAFLKQGVIAHEQGDARKAVFLAKKALTEDPKLADATAFLKQIGAD